MAIESRLGSESRQGEVSESHQEESARLRLHGYDGYEGLDKWLRCQASVLEVQGSNPAMTWLKITSLLSLPYRR